MWNLYSIGADIFQDQSNDEFLMFKHTSAM